MLSMSAHARAMTHNDSGELPLGARVLPGVDLQLWLLLSTAVVFCLFVTILALLVGDR